MEPLIPVCPKSRVAMWGEELQMERGELFFLTFQSVLFLFFIFFPFLDSLHPSLNLHRCSYDE